ncbi:hypothetical protein CONCODRAFT_20025 [Conidiobolus coronatus NRRL 28638]|uniref:Uncharacterized protein n=1 Tax=Conidiobolus coronatus (strain ATCC 28846 / CBS 209.66 / NRRL 28638) TaxID=796925 RepID=A0A137NVX0_CONC2|nr:hypothetical protein CONCODRAFT_20025 [Conidiobolus coronatus NRRL 28638]|eukprot:KXN66821.1 hypothetical protein CONCODRAFT_20025 [Conidiobolus coronatus NRRL 28638]
MDRNLVNWLNIIFKDDFVQYLRLESLKEISLSSRLVRERLKPKIFKHLTLSTYNCNFKFKDNILTEFINIFICPYNSNNISSNSDRDLKCLSAEKGLDDFAYSLKEIKKFSISFTLSDMERAGYYLVQLAYNFVNLTDLKLRSCTIPYSAFSKLGESLLNLENIELFLVNIAKLPSDDLNPDYFIFPPKLIALNIYQCSAANIIHLSNSYDFLFTKKSRLTYNNFTIPIVSAPSLKKLAISGQGLYYKELKPFLDINSNLESLKIEFFDLSVVKELNMLKSLELDLITRSNNSAQIPLLRSVNKLRINKLIPLCYENIEKLCLLCPNLEYLHFSGDYDPDLQASIVTFVEQILLKLQKLKTLRLLITTNEDEVLDITKFYNIDSIIIETESSAIFNLKFDKSIKLKKVKFVSTSTEINTQEFKDKFSIYNSWNFNFKYIGYLRTGKSSFGDHNDVNNNIKIQSVQSGLNDFTSSLKDIKKFSRSFTISEVNISGFYLFPIITSFDNLVSLKLDLCAVPLAEFYKLGESLVHLNNIELVLVTFIKLSMNDIKSDEIKFPRNLKCLDIYHCNVICIKSESNPVKFLLSDHSRVDTNDYALPNVAVPSLKKLSYISNDPKNAGIRSFLEANPNLDYLKIEIFSLSAIIKLNYLHSLEFCLMRPFNTKYNIPILESIKNLKISSLRSKYFENIRKLLTFCSNLEELHFVMDQYEQSQPSIDEFLVPVLSKLNQLKTLHLMITTYEEEILDITKFSNIESIIIKAESYIIFNLNFIKCKSLKKVELNAYTRKMNTQEYKYRFSGYKNWAFKFGENTIKGYKIQ